MKTIKVNSELDIPEYYTGIAEWEDQVKGWYKNGDLHREDGPATIEVKDYESWWLNGKYIYGSTKNESVKLRFTNEIILSKSQHPEYPTVQVWKILDSNGLYDFIVIPGMEKHIVE